MMCATSGFAQAENPAPPIGPRVAPQRYAGLSVNELSRQVFGRGAFNVVETLAVTDSFTRTLVSWESDGLTVYGFMNVPLGEGPFPVVIVNHGYVDPAIYNTLTYTTRYADALARAGFVAIHPNFRGYPPSDDGPNPLRVGIARDVLHLIGMVKRDGGRPGPMQAVDPESIGLWGHSMGGGVSLRVLVVSDDIDAAVLYGSMSGDEQDNHDRVLVFSGGVRGNWEEGQAPSEAELRRISPINALDRVDATVSIHHGSEDEQVPPEWSDELCGLLREAGKSVECHSYEGQPHLFVGDGDELFIERMIEFFQRTLQS
jgi:dipeptidyl aminopeptidase/acylaminoacyl peptidase